MPPGWQTVGVRLSSWGRLGYPGPISGREGVGSGQVQDTVRKTGPDMERGFYRVRERLV